MENKKDKNLLKLKKEKFSEKSDDYATTVKSDEYEDFEEVANRLRKEGRLNEENYAILKKKKKKYLTFLLLIFLFLSFISIYSGNGFLIFVFIVVFIIAPIHLKNVRNKLCYICTYGSESKGEVISIEKDFKQGCLANLVLTMDKNSCFMYKITYKFKTKNSQIITSFYNDPSYIFSLKTLSSYVLGQEVPVRYNKNDPEDSLIILPQFQCFNLLSKNS